MLQHLAIPGKFLLSDADALRNSHPVTNAVTNRDARKYLQPAPDVLANGPRGAG